VYNVFMFINKYGTDWIHQLVNEAPLPDGSHWVVLM